MSDPDPQSDGSVTPNKLGRPSSFTQEIADTICERRVEIYALLEPWTLEVRYIGKANCTLKRYAQHLRDAHRLKRPVNCWIKSLLDAGSAPEARILLSCPEDDWKTVERAQIAKARASGGCLLNLADGGDQIPVTVEQRQRCAATAIQKRSLTPEAKKRWNAARNLAGAARRGQLTQRQIERFRSRPDVFGFLFHIIGGPPASLLTE